MTQPKVWYRSKTLWLNATVFALGVVGILSGSSLFAHYSEALTLVTAILNFALRFLTVQPISGTAATPPVVLDGPAPGEVIAVPPAPGTSQTGGTP